MGKILFVDDEVLILNSLKRGLKRKEYDCYYANSGIEALKILEEVDIDVVFSDMKMPGMTGLELLKIIAEKYPDIVKIILSGYAQLPQLIATINQANIFKYVAKPWDLNNEIIPIIEESLTFAKYKKEMRLQHTTLEQKNKAFQKIFKSYTSKTETKNQGWDVLRIYHQVLMSQLKEQVKDTSLTTEESLNALEAYKNLTDYLINEIKKVEIYFEPSLIIKELELYFKQKKYALNFEIIEDKESSLPFEGRGLHIKPILLRLIEDLTDSKNTGSIKITSKALKKDDHKYVTSYILEASKSCFFKFDKDSYAIKLYKALLNVFGGDLGFKISEDKIGIVLWAQLYYNDPADLMPEA